MPKRKIKKRKRILKRRNNGVSSKDKKFKRRIRTIIIEALKIDGIGIYTACDYAGINYQSHREWMIKGKDKKKHPVHAWYRRQVKKAIALKEIEALAIIRKTAEGGEVIKERKITTGTKGIEETRIIKRKGRVWQAAAWYLERVHREKYGREPMLPGNVETPEEKARQVKEALDAMMGSVPTAPPEEPTEE